MFSKNDNQISNLPFFVKVKPCFDKLYCGFQEQVSLQNFSNLLWILGNGDKKALAKINRT